MYSTKPCRGVCVYVLSLSKEYKKLPEFVKTSNGKVSFCQPVRKIPVLVEARCPCCRNSKIGTIRF